VAAGGRIGGRQQLPLRRTNLGAGWGAIQKRRAACILDVGDANKRDVNFDLTTTNQKVGSPTLSGRTYFPFKNDVL
jgi:hypothetical protein